MDFAKIRYKGDYDDTQELYEVYQVKQIIDSHEDILKEHNSFRDQLLANSVRLTPTISPRISGIIEEVKKRFQLKDKIEYFSLRDLTYNAFAFKLQDNISIVFTSALLENLTDDEIKFVLGHELGHIIYDHNRLMLLYNPDKNSNTFLPTLAEKKFLTWQKKAEISSDRVGLLACDSYEAAVQALLKISYGLTEKNLNFNMKELMKQLDEIANSDYLSYLSEASHPILPVRLKALEHFKKSKIYNDKGIISKEDLGTKTDALINLTKLYPRQKTAEMIMKFVAAGSIKLIAHDKDIMLEEIKSLVKILANVFTDDPEKEIIFDKTKVEEQLTTSAKYILENGSDNDKFYSLHFITVVALSDGKFTELEKKLLLELAASVGFNPEEALGVIWQTLQQTGINIDVKLNEIAENVKQNYVKGIK